MPIFTRCLPSALTGSVTLLRSLPPAIAWAAAFHGSNLAPESGDSPHQRFAGLRSRIYVGVAGIDPTFGGAEEGRLAAALRDASVDHVIETYAGAAHGFVMEDLPVANAAAASRHWLRLSTQLRETFSQCKGAV
jgi:carboxymethylenebutenolidase